MDNTSPYERVAQWEKAFRLAQAACLTRDPLFINDPEFDWGLLVQFAEVHPPSQEVKDMAIDMVYRIAGVAMGLDGTGRVTAYLTSGAGLPMGSHR